MIRSTTEYVWIHVHEGTLISSYRFATVEAAFAFKERHDGNDDNNDRREWDEVPELPAGYRDDPDSDTWVLVEGQIALVDGEAPYDPAAVPVMATA